MSRKPNPFIRNEAPTRTEEGPIPALHDSVLGHKLMEHGPTDPSALPISAEDIQGPTWTFGPIPADCVTRVMVMGLHGGAGATTLAELLGESVTDHGTTWPVADDGKPVGVIAVCRSHWRGLDAADRFTQQWAAELLTGSTLLGLVIVDDGPSLSDGQQKAMKRLLKRTPRGFHIPWVEAWRHTSPVQGRTPARTTRIIRALHGAAAGF